MSSDDASQKRFPVGPALFCLFLWLGGMGVVFEMVSRPPSVDEVLDGSAVQRALDGAERSRARRRNEANPTTSQQQIVFPLLKASEEQSWY